MRVWYNHSIKNQINYKGGKMDKEMIPEIKRVTCLSCKKEVEIKLIPYGNGYIATCPKCGKLAYNKKE